jgi:hypothetical protein
MSPRHEPFRMTFAPAEFRILRAGYEGINPDRPLETAGIPFREIDPLVRSVIQETPELKSFVDEFLPHLGTFLDGPFPLPGGRTTRAAHGIAGGKPERTEGAASARSVKGRRVLKGSATRDTTPSRS